MKYLTIILSILVLIMLVFCTKDQVPEKPPTAKVENVVDEYYGVKVDDPYRYMEDLDDPYVQDWVKAQAEYADHILQNLPERKALLKRLQELDTGKAFTSGAFQMQKDGSLFYMKRLSGENVYKLYYRDKDGEEKLLVDPEAVPAEEGEHFSLEVFSPSVNGDYLVYGLAKSGSEETVLYVINVETGEKLPESIDRIETAYNRPHWLPDGSGFFYSRRRNLPEEAPETEIYKQTKIFFHKLNTPAEKDQLVAGINVSDRMPLTEVDFPSLYIPAGSEHAVVKIKHGDSNELTLYTAPINTLLQKDVPWTKVCDVQDEVTDYAVHADDIFLQTSKDAPRFKIVHTSLLNPNMRFAGTVIPESEAVIDYVRASSQALYTGLVDGGVERILRLDLTKKADVESLQLPENASGWVTAVSPAVKGVLIRTSSWTQGGVVYAYDPDADTYKETDLLPKGKFDDLDGYESVEVKVESHDGVMVPLSIIYKSDIEMNGKNPTLIRGYGAYGIISYVYFNPLNIAWLERGGVLTVAHIRGGGEYGKAWHLAGQKTTKPNTWKDFIACAEYLIDEGYTSHDYIAGQGGSAGGITIGRAVTERPDLFKAALINVGDLDAVRMETTTNGVPNIPEFGTVTIEEEFHALLEMSSYHHVTDSVEYPAVLLSHGMNDPRVEPWNSAKMTARLQAATGSDNPILFRVDYSSGHGIGSTRQQYLEELADEWAFLLWQFGK